VDQGTEAGTETDTRAGLRRDVRFERTWLDEASWVDVARGVITEPDDLVTALTENLSWGDSKIFRYDHWVDVPRLGAGYPLDRPPHPVLHDVHRALQHRYGVRFAAPAVAWYRDERDSVAFHRDRDMRWLDDTRIALLVVGHRRPFVLRPRSHRYAHDLPDKGAVVDLAPGQGDLLVMGGGCQAGWEHSVPKVSHRVGPRLSVQWRWTSRQGRQEQGGSYGDPVHFSSR
jgi:alkylated DNA repair dioxygenase AlkB